MHFQSEYIPSWFSSYPVQNSYFSPSIDVGNEPTPEVKRVHTPKIFYFVDPYTNVRSLVGRIYELRREASRFSLLPKDLFDYYLKPMVFDGAGRGGAVSINSTQFNFVRDYDLESETSTRYNCKSLSFAPCGDLLVGDSDSALISKRMCGKKQYDLEGRFLKFCLSRMHYKLKEYDTYRWKFSSLEDRAKVLKLDKFQMDEVHFDLDENIYFGCRRKIRVYDKDFKEKFVMKFPPADRFVHANYSTIPNTFCIDERNKKIYVVLYVALDPVGEDFRLGAFDFNGEFIKFIPTSLWTASDPLISNLHPNFVRLDFNGNILISTQTGLHLYSPEGILLKSCELSHEATAVAVKACGQVHLYNKNNHKVSIYQ